MAISSLLRGMFSPKQITGGFLQENKKVNMVMNEYTVNIKQFS